MDKNYTFSAHARPVNDIARYREIPPEPTMQYCNIVVDPRIKRGAAFNRMNTLSEQVERLPSYPRRTARRSVDGGGVHDGYGAGYGSISRDGFSEALVQTDDFDGNVIIVKNEEHVGVQTDPYTEKPIVHRKPAALRAKGVKTEVPGTALFDWEVQVQPFVKRLVNKALSQAAMEYQEEEELAYMKMYLKAYHHAAEKEEEAVRRLEEEEFKKFQQKEEIVKKMLEIEQNQFELRQKILARGFAEFFVWDIQDDVMELLKNKNYFYDEVERDIQLNFLPLLSDEVIAAINKPSVPKALAQKALQNAEELCENAENQGAIDVQIGKEQNQARALRRLRLMLAEDIVAKQLREIRKQELLKKSQQEEEEDHEEEEEHVSEPHTESTYESDDNSNLANF